MKRTAFSLNWIRSCLHELSLSRSFMGVRAVECILQWAFSVQNGPAHLRARIFVFIPPLGWPHGALYMRSELGIPAATSRGRVTAETGWLTQSVGVIPCWW